MVAYRTEHTERLIPISKRLSGNMTANASCNIHSEYRRDHARFKLSFDRKLCRISPNHDKMPST